MTHWAVAKHLATRRIYPAIRTVEGPTRPSIIKDNDKDISSIPSEIDRTKIIALDEDSSTFSATACAQHDERGPRTGRRDCQTRRRHTGVSAQVELVDVCHWRGVKNSGCLPGICSRAWHTDKGRYCGHLRPGSTCAGFGGLERTPPYLRRLARGRIKPLYGSIDSASPRSGNTGVYAPSEGTREACKGCHYRGHAQTHCDPERRAQDRRTGRWTLPAQQ